jgi:hypothetical protein
MMPLTSPGSRITGTMHVNDADGTCARMRMTYRNAAGTDLATRYGSTLCVDDDDHHELPIDLDPYADDSLDRVQVAVERQSALGWSTVESSTYTVDTHDDNVKITEDGVDFGGSGWGTGAPSGSGAMVWKLDDGDVTPNLEGFLHLNNSSGVCARVKLRYFTDAGLLLTTREDDAYCASDNGHHSWWIDFEPYESNKVGEVRVQLQTLANEQRRRPDGLDRRVAPRRAPCPSRSRKGAALHPVTARPAGARDTPRTRRHGRGGAPSPRAGSRPPRAGRTRRSPSGRSARAAPWWSWR